MIAQRYIRQFRSRFPEPTCQLLPRNYGSYQNNFDSTIYLDFTVIDRVLISSCRKMSLARRKFLIRIVNFHNFYILLPFYSTQVLYTQKIWLKQTLE